MLGRERDDMVLAERTVEMRRALDGKVVRLGRARGEHDLARLGADELRKLRPRALDRIRRLAAISVRDRAGIAEFLCEPRQHFLEHARIARRRRLVIEIDGRVIAHHAALARVRA